MWMLYALLFGVATDEGQLTSVLTNPVRESSKDFSFMQCIEPIVFKKL